MTTLVRKIDLDQLSCPTKICTSYQRTLEVEGPKNNSAKYTELVIKVLGISFYTVIYIGLEIKDFGLTF
jgi:hypothetical protein